MRLSFLAVSASIRLIVLTGFCVIAACGDVSNYDIHNESFKRLLNVRSQKKTELIKYLADVHERAKMITSDDVMMSFFWANRHDETNPGRPSAEAEYEMNKHYVNHYGDFYDILFIYSTGFVFHTIKRESDYHKNILTGSFSGSMLAENLRNHSDISFVDFEYYEPSREPAAFFIVPIRENGLLKGWFVLQYALNQINALLTHREKLGRTGEVYLVNRDFYMLSDSRFIKDDIKLKKRVNTEAVKSAFADKDGNKLLIDYRGINVFSSFELLDIFESQWVIIAEIDEDEVITDYFLKNSDSCVNGILNYLSEQNVNNFIPQKDIRDFIKVDINECAIGRPGELLGTKGVAYCTALAVSFKNRFSYLAHISPIDN